VKIELKLAGLELKLAGLELKPAVLMMISKMK
jgi:hypothetical protein